MAWYDFLYKRVHLDSDERILREGPARIFQGIFVFEGKLMLSDRRLLFVPQRPWFWIPVLSFSLEDVRAVRDGGRLAKLVVRAAGRRYSFWLPGGKGRGLYGLASEEPENWTRAIEAARSRS